MLLSLLRVSLDLVYPWRLSDTGDGWGGKWGLASDDLDITNERTAKIHHIGCCGSQRTRFEPEHLVHSMVLSTVVRPVQSQREGEDLNSLSAETHP